MTPSRISEGGSARGEGAWPKGTGDPKKVVRDEAPHGQQRLQNPEQQGQQGNIKQNTTNQGYQQDR